VQYLLVKQQGCHPLDIVATLSIGSLPPTQVVPRYPTTGSAVAPESSVPFAWQAFPGATNYLFHIWLVNQSSSIALSKYSQVTFSTLVYHKTSYTWNNHGFLPGVYQYQVLPLDTTGKALASFRTPVQITVAS